MQSRLAAAAAALALVTGSAWAAPVTIQPANGKDAQLVSGNAGTNYGNYSFVMDNWGDGSRAIALVEFDLSAYAGSSVTSAFLGLWQMFNQNAGANYQVFRVTSAWNEGTVTYNSAPTIDPVAVASLVIGDNGIDVWREWDITSTVNGWLSGAYGNFGLWIEEVPIQGSATAYFASSDGASGTGPRLRFDTHTVPEPGTLLLVAAALGAGLASRRRR